MITLEYLDLSIGLARRGHEGQMYHLDTGDVPYFDGHIEPVAELVRGLGYGPICQAAAYLHDYVEDTPGTPDNLLEQGVPEAVVDIVRLVTVVKGQSHARYLQAIISNPGAVAVKYADSSINFANSALALSRSSDNDKAVIDKLRRRVEKYTNNLRVLSPYLPKKPYM